MPVYVPRSSASDVAEFEAHVKGLGGIQKPAANPQQSSRTQIMTYAANAAKKRGIDPQIFLRQGQQESGFRGEAVSGAGATGDYQVVQASHPNAPTERLARIDYAADFMASLLKKYGGDYTKALAAYNAGPGTVDKVGGVPDYAETKAYVSNILGNKSTAYISPEELTAVLATPAQAQRPVGQANPKDLAPDQFNSGTLPDDEAWAACGPAAAIGFAKRYGRNPSWSEAMALAKATGFTAKGGMNGPENELALLQKIGVPARLDRNVNPDEIIKDVSNGNPVAISTGDHYYFATGYDQPSGKLYVGITGKNRLGGSEWMSIQEIQTLDAAKGGINAVLFADHPSSANSSVAARSSEGIDSSGRDDYRLTSPKAEPTPIRAPEETPEQKMARKNEQEASMVRPFQPPGDVPYANSKTLDDVGFEAPAPSPQTDPMADFWKTPRRQAA